MNQEPRFSTKHPWRQFMEPLKSPSSLCVLWGWPKTSPSPLARQEGLAQEKKFWAGCLPRSPAQYSSCCLAAELVQSWFLISALQGGYSQWYQPVEELGFFWGGVFRNFSFSALFPYPFSSTDLAEDHCLSKKKNRVGRTCWSEIPAGMFSSSVLWFSRVVAVQIASTGMLSINSILLWRQKQFFLPCASPSFSTGRSCKVVMTLLCSCVELSTGARHQKRIAQCCRR